MRYPTRSIGDAALVASRVVSIGYVRLAAVLGHNNHTLDVYIQIHELAAAPTSGTGVVPKFSVLAFAGLPYSFALPAVVDMDKCVVCVSSVLASYTQVGAGTYATIQAIVAS